MEKRLIAALLLSLVTVYLYSAFFLPDPPPKPPTETGTETGTVKTPAPEEASSTENPPPEENPDTPFERVRAEVEEEIVIDTENYRAVFTNRGAILRELKLKQYYNRPELEEEEKLNPDNWQTLISESRRGFGALRMEDVYKRSGSDLEEVLWQARKITAGRNPGVEFRYDAGNGATFVKRVEFPEGTYHAEVTLEVENQNKDFATQDWVFHFLPSAGVTQEEDDPYYPHPVSVTGYRQVGGDVELETFIPVQSASPTEPLYSFPNPGGGRSIVFAGDYGKYFGAFCQPWQGTQIEFTKSELLLDEAALALRREENPGIGDAALSEGLYRLGAVRCGITFHVPQVGNTETKKFLLFLGPKDPAILKDAERFPHYGIFLEVLDDDLGWFSFFGKIMLWILRILYAVIGNYGVSIIVLTIIIRGALFPLSRKQQISMQGYQKKVAKVKPLLDEIQKKHKGNRQKMYEEQLKIYKKHGITAPPLGGCLTMFLQFPIFIGLYTSLRVAFDLRHAPFLWVNDLARPDELVVLGDTYNFLILSVSAINLLPVLVLISSIWMSKSMPKPSDPQQAQMQKIMTFMFAFFFIFFYNTAAGLNLYLTTTFLWSVFEYKVVRKAFPVPKASS